jgi:predicted MFS family arabinose efflux permease
MSKINTKGAWMALVFGHMAGMIDLAALPVWVGTLIGGFGFMPAQAGGLVTLFLAGVVVSSVLLSPIFHKMNGRWMAPLGFWISTLAFLGMSQTTGFPAFALLHLIAGLGTGLAISFVHGTMGRTSNPHRVFAMGSFGLGITAVLFLGVAPPLIAANGPKTLFFVFVGVMGLAAILTTLLFPSTAKNEDVVADTRKFDKAVWLVIFAIMGMALNNAMILSFAERIGIDSGFAPEKVQMALISMGFVAILPSLLAAYFQKRLSPLKVAVAGAILHGALGFVIMGVPGFAAYIIPLVFFPFVMVFTHTFVFGYLAAIEPTGRAVAATPAMIMTGSATAPLLGGILVQSVGYNALGFTALAIGLISMLLFIKAKKRAQD